MGLERGADGETVFAGHDDIEEDDFGAFAREDGAGGVTTVGEEDAHTFAAEGIAHDAEAGGGIVDDEDGGSVHG